MVIKMTNYEKIKQMTVEEFAKMFNAAICRQITFESFDNCNPNGSSNCQECTIAWLNQEVEK